MKVPIDAMLPYTSLQESLPALLSCLRLAVRCGCGRWGGGRQFLDRDQG